MVGGQDGRGVVHLLSAVGSCQLDFSLHTFFQHWPFVTFVRLVCPDSLLPPVIQTGTS